MIDQEEEKERLMKIQRERERIALLNCKSKIIK
jgi:hypothetical protein